MLSPQLNDILTLIAAIASPVLGFFVFRANRKEKREKKEEKLQSKIWEVRALKANLPTQHKEMYLADKEKIKDLEAEIKNLEKVIGKKET